MPEAHHYRIENFIFSLDVTLYRKYVTFSLNVSFVYSEKILVNKNSGHFRFRHESLQHRDKPGPEEDRIGVRTGFASLFSLFFERKEPVVPRLIGCLPYLTLTGRLNHSGLMRGAA